MDVDGIEFASAVTAAWLFWAGVVRGDAAQQAGLVLTLVTGGLVWESYDPWMAADTRPALLRAAATVIGFATVAMVTSLRSDDRWRAPVALVGAAEVTVAVLRYDLGQYRSMTILSAAVLAVVAVGVGVHIPLMRHAVRRETREAAAAVHSLWLAGMVWAVLTTMWTVARRVQPMPRWAEVLVEAGSTAGALAVLLIGLTLWLMWRHRGFADGYATQMSQTLIEVRGAMVGAFLLVLVGTALSGLARAVSDPRWTAPIVWFTAGYLALVGSNAARIIRREAVRQRRSSMTAPASAAVRDLASDDPVYRLLPGVTEKPD